MYYRNAAGTYYYQGALQVSYRASFSGATDVFGAVSMSLRTSTGKASGLAHCPSRTWQDGDAATCYSPTVTFRGDGEGLYAKGGPIDSRGIWHYVWSPVLRTS